MHSTLSAAVAAVGRHRLAVSRYAPVLAISQYMLADVICA